MDSACRANNQKRDEEGRTRKWEDKQGNAEMDEIQREEKKGDTEVNDRKLQYANTSG